MAKKAVKPPETNNPAAFAGGENTEAELHSRFFLFSYIRSGRKQYLVGKATAMGKNRSILTLFIQ